MDYAIIKLGNKQHRVRDGERLVVDRLHTEAGKSFEPVVLLGDAAVTATVIAHERGPKLLIGKYRKRTGYKRHNGFRAATSRVEITIGADGAKRAAAAAAARAKPEVAPATESAAKVEATPKVEAAPKVAQAPKVEVAAPVAPAETPDATTALPSGYEAMTVAQIGAGAKEWSHAELTAAVAYEQAHAARKGALSALELALAKEGD
jgi:large subunit ribosomal protein L21